MDASIYDGIEKNDYLLLQQTLQTGDLTQRLINLEGLHLKYPENNLLKIRLADSYGILGDNESAIDLLIELSNSASHEEGVIIAKLEEYQSRMKEMISKGKIFQEKAYNDVENLKFGFTEITQLSEEEIASKEFFSRRRGIKKSVERFEKR